MFIDNEQPLGLLTDEYQITMGQAYFSEAKDNTSTTTFQEPISCCELFFRKTPFGANYAINAGLDEVIEYISKFRFSESDIDYLREQKQGDNETSMYTEDFLNYLLNLRITCDIDAIPEGTVVFANQPLLRITGPRIQVQLLESALIQIINFQTLIASKTSIIKEQCQGKKLLDFGLRRAQNIAASIAAYKGGADATSNKLLGKLYGIPTGGTFAHAFVMSHPDELSAFRAYAKALPGNCIYLVDTYDVKQGIENAITVANEQRKIAKKLFAKGKISQNQMESYGMLGIRLDSGNLAKLSIYARKRLTDAGYPNALIVASNDLNEEKIAKLHQEGAQIDAFGVGTELVTGGKQSALGCVYKVVATQNDDLSFEGKIKISECPEKTTIPGRHQIRRYFEVDEGNGDKIFLCDAMYDIDMSPSDKLQMILTSKPNVIEEIDENTPYGDLLVPIYRKGELVYDCPSLPEIREQAKAQLKALPAKVKQLQNSEPYPAFVEARLHDKKMDMLKSLRVVRKFVASTVRSFSSITSAFFRNDAAIHPHQSDITPQHRLKK